MRHILASIACLAIAAPAAAQLDHLLVVDQAASQFTWTGDTSIGRIIGVPDNNFDLSGTLVMSLTEGVAGPISAGRFVSADIDLPYIKGEIPNIFGPPLAVIELINVKFTATSPTFNVAANGAFSTQVTLTATQGQLVITPLIGGQTVINLAGVSADPTAVNGALSHSGGDVNLNVPISVMFSFVDPGTGISGDLTLNGTLVADYTCPAPTNYCVLSPNSVGAGAVMSNTGSPSVFDNDLVLRCTNAPPQVPGLFFYGTDQQQAPVGDGTLCIGGNIFRLPVVGTNAAGTASFNLDLGNLPNFGDIFAGDTRNFAYWYRDIPGGPAGYNFSDGLEVRFCL